MGSQTDQLPGRQHLGPAVLFGSICDDDGNGDRAGGGSDPGGDCGEQSVRIASVCIQEGAQGLAGG